VYMTKVSKMKAIIIRSLVLSACLSTFTVDAQQTVIDDGEGYYVGVQESLPVEVLDQVLAPIALYPDALLSQILVASTYPLEVVQAARWRQDNAHLNENRVLAAIEHQQWDPSVKALTPFTDLITNLSDDLDWLQLVGDAFLQNEYQVLARVQELRQKAYYEGSLVDNDYYDVINDNGNIIIQSAHKEIIYVPYYDSRVVYGHWGRNDYQPVYWHHPSHYRLHAGFYWSNNYYIKPTIFFGGFRWGLRSLVVNKHFYDKPYSRNSRFRNISISKYRKWKHNPVHRRGVKVSRFGNRGSFRNNQSNFRSRTVRQPGFRSNDNRRVNNRNVSNNVRNRNSSFNRNDQRVSQQKINRQKKQIRTIINSKNNTSVNRKTGNSDITHSTPRKKAARQALINNAKAKYRSGSASKIKSNKTSTTRKVNNADPLSRFRASDTNSLSRFRTTSTKVPQSKLQRQSQRQSQRERRTQR